MNSNSITPFNYHEKEIRIIQDKNGNPWWIARDICDILEINDHLQAVERLDDDERGRYKIPTPGGNQNMITINEPGLYTLIIRSNKPEAKKFKRWITHEVIPAIRKTGFYSMPNVTTIDLKPIVKNLAALKRTAMIAGYDEEDAVVQANEAIIKNGGPNLLKMIGATHLLDRRPDQDMVAYYEACIKTDKVSDVSGFDEEEQKAYYAACINTDTTPIFKSTNVYDKILKGGK